ncbi:MAG TPA: hypothetical protein VNB22_17515, partial [Pyrinomonadaceae bacterium]|nr:hypothetical protein [Pyrinomonadaceae bacterium]
MKLKHFAAIFVFLTSFVLSVLVVGLPVRKACEYRVSVTKETQPRRENNDLKARMFKFLEADRQTGRELADDSFNFRIHESAISSELQATDNLVAKMKRVKC